MMDVDVDIAKSNANEIANAAKLKSNSKNHYTNNASVRMQRNQAEKQRRDRLNDQIAKLATIVPTVVNATKPLDKVSILRLAASWMRLNYSCLNPKNFKSSVENYLNLHSSIVSNLDTIEKSIQGFVLAITLDGIILMCSRYAEDHIGYQNIDLLGHQITDYILEKDKQLFEKKIRNLISKYKRGSEKKLQNIVRLHLQQRPLPRSNDVRYRKMSFSMTIHSGTTAQNKFRSRYKIGKHKDFGENAVILIFAEPTQIEPEIDVRYLDQKDCYFTVHGPQGEIIFADHRISTMTGYMPCNVLGNSAYQYIHSSDVPIALFAQREMFESTNGTGIITYRLRICDSSYIFLQSKGQIRYKDSSKEIRQFICYNRLLNKEEGTQELKKFQERYSPQLASSKFLKPTKFSKEKEILSHMSAKKTSDCNNISPKLNILCGEVLMKEKAHSSYASSVEGAGSVNNFHIDLNQTEYNAQKDNEVTIHSLTGNKYHSFEARAPTLISYSNKAQSYQNVLLNDLECYSNELNNKASLSNTFSLANDDMDFSSNIQKSLKTNICHQLNEAMDYLDSVDLDGLDINFTNKTTSFQKVANLIPKDYFKASIDHNRLDNSTFTDTDLLMQIQGKNISRSVQNFNACDAERNPLNFISENTFQEGSEFVSNPLVSSNESALINPFELNQESSILENIYTSSKSHTLSSEREIARLNVAENGHNNLHHQNDNLSNAQAITEIEESLDLSFLDQTVDEMSLLNELTEFSLPSETYHQMDLLKTNGAISNSSATISQISPNGNITESSTASVLSQTYPSMQSKQLSVEGDRGIEPNICTANNLTGSIYGNTSLLETCLTSPEKSVVNSNLFPKYYFGYDDSQSKVKASKPCFKGNQNDGNLNKSLEPPLVGNSNSVNNNLLNFETESMKDFDATFSENSMYLLTSSYPCSPSSFSSDILPLPKYYKMSSLQSKLDKNVN